MNSLQQPLPAAWLVAWLSFGILIGIAFAWTGWQVWLPTWWMTVLGFVVALACGKKPAWWSVGAFIGAGIVFGLWRGGHELQQASTYRLLWHTAQSVQGIVEGDPADAAGLYKLTLHHLQIGEQRLPGAIWVSMPTQHTIQRGDKIEIYGKLSPGFGAFQAALYRAELKTVRREPSLSLQVRDSFAAAIRQSIPEPQASLGIGFLLGQQTALPTDLTEQLQVVGLTHAVVASGYNVTILVLLARRSLQRISKYIATIGSLLLVLSFITIAGFGPSMVRAGIVTILSLVAWYYGRAIPPLVLLLFVAAITSLANPFYVWGDLGWYLSFLAFGGVLWLAPLVRDLFFKRRSVGILATTVLEASCAQLVTLPLLLHVFGLASVYSLPANVMIVPLIPLAMGLTFAAGLASFMGLLLGQPATWVLTYMTQIIGWFAHLPFAQINLEFSLFAMVTAYAVMMGGMVLLANIAHKKRKKLS